MIIGFLLMICAAALFAALNLFAAGVLVSGVILFVALWLRRKAEFWPLLLSMALLFGGGGALGFSWGAYWVISQQTPDWGWPILSWICGYIAGACGGTLLGALAVIVRRRRELPFIKSQISSKARSERVLARSKPKFRRSVFGKECGLALIRCVSQFPKSENLST